MGYRTDLALELREDLMTEAAEELAGISCTEETLSENIKITVVKIQDEDAAKRMGKPIGSYITIEAAQLGDRDVDYAATVSTAIGNELKKLYTVTKDSLVLVVGLGNRNLTPDSLGPCSVEKVLVTRHLLDTVPESVDERVRSVCAIAPGVLGITGIETSEVVKGIVHRLKPTAVIAIDALACRRAERICTTIQIADTGISPGAGIGNKRKALNEKSLGIPVIAIGVPMVVYASTLTMDVLERMREDSQGKLKEDLASTQVTEAMITAANAEVGDMIVTPKDIDLLISDTAAVLGMGINLALHDRIELSEFEKVVH